MMNLNAPPPSNFKNHEFIGGAWYVNWAVTLDLEYRFWWNCFILLLDASGHHWHQNCITSWLWISFNHQIKINLFLIFTSSPLITHQIFSLIRGVAYKSNIRVRGKSNDAWSKITKMTLRIEKENLWWIKTHN